MHRPLLVVAALVAFATTLLLTPGTSLAASHAGPCVGTEGVTVVVDMNPVNDSAPTAPVDVRCAIGSVTDGIEALSRAGYSFSTHTQYGDPFVCTISSLPTNCFPSGGYWSYWNKPNASATTWSESSVGAGDATPQPGALEGWRWVPDYMVDTGVAPRAIPAAASLSAVGASATGAHAATVSATIAAGGTAQEAHVEFGADRTSAVRTSVRTVAAGATTATTFDLTSLAAGATFTYRVVTTGALGTVASEWATFTTPRPAVRLRVTSTETFAHRGERVHVDVERLAAGETVIVRLGDVELGSANADLEGDARVTVRIPAATKAGRTTLTATGSGSDRTGNVAVTVTAAETLPVTTRQLRDGRWFVTVSGLEAGEPVTLTQGRTVAARGVANRLGKFGATFRATARTVVATGSHASRTGSTSLPTESARRRR